MDSRQRSFSPSRTLDAYATRGLLAANPFVRPGAFLETVFASLLPRGDCDDQRSVGVDFSDGFSNDLAVALYKIGYRRFAVSPGRRDELRLILAQRRQE